VDPVILTGNFGRGSEMVLIDRIEIQTEPLRPVGPNQAESFRAAVIIEDRHYIAAGR
jgi:hypothetical protein